MEKREFLNYQTPELTVVEIKLEGGIALTSVRFKEGDNVIQEEAWTEKIYGNPDNNGGDYEIFI